MKSKQIIKENKDNNEKLCNLENVLYVIYKILYANSKIV